MRLPKSWLPAPGATRPLAVITFLQALGLGLLTPVSAIYFTRFVGLSVAQFGLGMTLAGGVGLAVGVPVGHLSDRRGPRGLLLALLSLVALAVAGYLMVDSFLGFLAVVALYRLSDRAAGAVRGGLMARVIPADQQVATRGYLRAVSNVGTSLGALSASWPLYVNAGWAFRTLMVGAAVLCALAALAALRLPAVPPVERAVAVRGTAVLRDRRYLGFAVLNAVLSFHFAVLEVGFPLYVAQHPEVPQWLVTVLFIINTGLVVALQVPLGRFADTVPSAKRATVWAGLLLAGACTVLGVAPHLWVALSVGLLLVAGVLHALGEILQVASGWSLAYEMAPQHAHGQYQGLFSTSTSTGLMAGASVVSLVAINGGQQGWLMLGALFLAASCAMPLVLRFSGTVRLPHTSGAR